MVALSFRMKSFFFDRPKVIRAIGRGEAKALGKIGAFVRKRARSLLRRRKRTSAAGEPPSVHSQNPDASLRKILFAYDERRHSVIIGPVRLNQVDYSSAGMRPIKGTVPRVLELGGEVRIREEQITFRNGGRKWIRADQRTKRVRNHHNPQRYRLARYAARPFMAPALKHEAPKFPGCWANSVS